MEVIKKQNGGARPGAGRKPKAEEQAIAERLSPLDDLAFEALKAGLQRGEPWAVKLHFSYKYGMPKQTIEQTNLTASDLLTAIEKKDSE